MSAGGQDKSRVSRKIRRDHSVWETNRNSVKVVSGLTLASALAVMAQSWSHLSAAPASPQQTCQKADDATVVSLTDQWITAIKSQHPDHIARLFADDGTMLGFASSVPRASYAAIREYYLYFFQFAPQVRLEESQLELGCNYLIRSGNYTWLLKTSEGGSTTNLPARYRFIYEYDDGRWQIGESVEELTLPEAQETAFNVPDPQSGRSPIMSSAEGTAVAGYVKRADPPPVANIMAHHSLPAQLPAHLGRQEGRRSITARIKTRTQPALQPADAHSWQSEVFQYSK